MSDLPVPHPATAPAGPSLAEFNDLDPADAAELLGACLDIDEWVRRVGAGRPYADLTALHAAGTAAATTITWDQCAGALARHPRIGEKKPAVAGTAAESAWSRDEQSGIVPDEQCGAGREEVLRRGNEAYEARFGYIFLICAAGLSGDEIIRALNRRMAHDDRAERSEVVQELTKIALLRLAKAVHS